MWEKEKVPYQGEECRKSFHLPYSSTSLSTPLK